MSRKPANEEQTTSPPQVIWPACGAFCDIFWWARRPPVKNDSKEKPVIEPAER